MDEPKVIFTTLDQMEAQMVRGLLESHGIQAFVLDANMNRIDPWAKHALGGMRITVRPEDYSRAQKVLQSKGQSGNNAR